MEITDLFIQSIQGTAQWVWDLITMQVDWHLNYFYGLLLISFGACLLEVFFPWRKNQALIRRDFWLDGFYMFFNFFIFTTIISGFYTVISFYLENVGLGIKSLTLIDLSSMPFVLQLVVFFILMDFVQWFTHILLHKVPLFWRFHKVHHSVIEMGFAAHLRYHWMENIFYKPAKTIALMILGGIEPEMAYVIHFFSVSIGHLNHANIKLTWGPLKYIFNNPVMHLWHHARQLPDGRKYGVNFGISLSLWDYIFGTDYIPEENGEIELGFENVEEFPQTFLGQLKSGFRNDKDTM